VFCDLCHRFEFHSFDHVGVYLLSHVFGRDDIDTAMTKGSNCQNVGGLSADVQYQVNVSQMRKHEKVCMCLCVYIYIYIYIYMYYNKILYFTKCVPAFWSKNESIQVCL
jgi:hypothetical protein